MALDATWNRKEVRPDREQGNCPACPAAICLYKQDNQPYPAIYSMETIAESRSRIRRAIKQATRNQEGTPCASYSPELGGHRRIGAACRAQDHKAATGTGAHSTHPCPEEARSSPSIQRVRCRHQLSAAATHEKRMKLSSGRIRFRCGR